MKLKIKEAATVSFLAFAATVTSCVESEKDLYDSTFRSPSPMGEIVAPDGFDWQLSSTIHLTVKVNDEFQGAYYYVVEVFDANPALSVDAHLLNKGVAKTGQPFTTEMAVSKAISQLYIRQTAPNGLASIRAYSTENARINCDFSAANTPATRSNGVDTRGFVMMEAPNTEDPNLFPQKSPTNTVFVQGNFQAGKSYKVTAATTQINLWSTNISLYVTENVTLTEQPYLATGCKLFLLPGVTLTLPQARNNGQSGCLISIGKGANLQIKGDIQLDSNYKLYNVGTVSATNFTCTNSSFFYNAGITSITNKLSGENGDSQLLNDGDLAAKEIILAGNSHLVNQQKVNVTGTTTINSNTASWMNDGEWTTEQMTTLAWNNFILNKCKLIVKQRLNLNETKLTIDAGAFVKCQRLFMNNTLIQMGAKSLFVVTEQAEYNYQTSSRGYKGTGTERALVKVKKTIATNPNSNDMIHYAGNLQIVCDDHPNAKVDPWNTRWTLTGGAEWASESNYSVAIAKSDCNEGSSNQPAPPTNPDFPIIVESSTKYSLMFEDQWPLYGDYDMNDIVMRMQGSKMEIDTQNTTKRFSFTLTLQAVGATRLIAAAIMLDKVPASAIESVEYGGNVGRPTTFKTTGSGIESDQEMTVIPLFDDAHQLMEKSTREFINTLSASNNNIGNSELPEMKVTINLKQKMPESNFNINHLNYFIITDNKRENRKEIHMAGYLPSQRAITTLFGGNDDGSSEENYYVSKENLAWGIIVPQQFKWPLEFHNIKDVYDKFESWVTSGGAENNRWWNDFDTNKVFLNNKN